MMALHALGFRRAAPRKRALSFLSLFRRQRPAAAGAGRIKLINGLPGFAENHSERDPVRGSARRFAPACDACAAAPGEKPFARFGNCGASCFDRSQLWQPHPLF
jgi:hypothetical protein